MSWNETTDNIANLSGAPVRFPADVRRQDDIARAVNRYPSPKVLKAAIRNIAGLLSRPEHRRLVTAAANALRRDANTTSCAVVGGH